MNFYTRSDLAFENVADMETPLKGVTQREEQVGDFRILEVCIADREASEQIGKPIGVYLTLECGRFNLLGEAQEALLEHLLADRLSDMARRLTKKEINSEFSLLAVGLGNDEMTADAVGPRTVAGLTATRHLRAHAPALYRSAGCTSLSLVSPGVLGQTGMEALEILQGALKCVCPDLVLVVDALAARSCDRLASTVQLSDVGISPGSGVGNHRAPLTQETLGVPVIALGVPTVVNSATLVYDVLEQAGIEDPCESVHKVLETGKSFFVSPKDCDAITAHAARILSGAIRQAFSGI